MQIEIWIMRRMYCLVAAVVAFTLHTQIGFAQARVWRAERPYSGIASFAYFDLIIPSKLGLTAAYSQGADRTYEFEYIRVVSYFPRFAALKLQFGMSF